MKPIIVALTIAISTQASAFSTAKKSKYIVGEGIMDAAYIAINDEAEANGDYEMDYVETCEFLFDGKWSDKFDACIIER